MSLLKVLESFTAILRSTIESLPRVVISWLADADKVDNFNVNSEKKNMVRMLEDLTPRGLWPLGKVVDTESS